MSFGTLLTLGNWGSSPCNLLTPLAVADITLSDSRLSVSYIVSCGEVVAETDRCNLFRRLNDYIKCSAAASRVALK